MQSPEVIAARPPLAGTALFLLAMALATAMTATIVHWQQPYAHALSRFMPMFLGVACVRLIVRQLQRPERLHATPCGLAGPSA